jgi:hypothetical protein
LGPEHTSTLDTVHNLGALYADQGKLVEAEQMCQRALQGYERLIGTDSIITYVPALKTIWGLGSLSKRQGDIAKARTMYSKAYIGYEKVFGSEHLESQRLWKMLRSLDAETQNRTQLGVEEPLSDLQVGLSQLNAGKSSSKSKRHSLLRKLGWRKAPT